MTSRFFDESRDQSRVKARIVSKYFWAWAKVIQGTAKRYARDKKIVYIDLFAGPGRYKDGTDSTPLLVLNTALQEPDLRDNLVTLFNDADENNVQALQSAIEALPNIETLKHTPHVANQEVGDQIVKFFEERNLAPTLFFVDPWGYKGLSLRLVNSVVKNWGCDCVFFFNYNRINMGLSNPLVAAHMDALFGERADSLRDRLESLDPEQRELTIVEALAQALKDEGGRFVLPFGFRNEKGTRTTHHLIFVSKHFRGYEIMKGIMAKESSTQEQGVASFQYSPADERQPLLFGYNRPLDSLIDELPQVFAGKTLTMRKVYEIHSRDTPFVPANYKEALRRLEESGRVTANPPASQRPKRKGVVTLADKTRITFPEN